MSRLFLMTIALALTAGASTAGGGCFGDHAGQAQMTVADAASQQSTPSADSPFLPGETVVAQISCADLTGDALVTCLAAQATE